MVSRSCFIIIALFVSAVQAQQSNSPIALDFLLGKFDYRTAPGFIKVKKEHAVKTIYLNAVVYQAFKDMQASAKEDGIELKILSGTRNFNEQKAIWERKWTSLGGLNPVEKAQSILEFSSMPATSRHHWGTDIDLNSLENGYFEKGRGKAEYDWLLANANKYGFYQVYSSQESGRTGYKEEKWHWSYLPLASLYLEQFNKFIGYSEITGFEGSEFAEDIQILSNYVNGIQRELQHPLPVTPLPQKVVLHTSSLEE